MEMVLKGIFEVDFSQIPLVFHHYTNRKALIQEVFKQFLLQLVEQEFEGVKLD